jgi:hypothetical protein
MAASEGRGLRTSTSSRGAGASMVVLLEVEDGDVPSAGRAVLPALGVSSTLLLSSDEEELLGSLSSHSTLSRLRTP